MGYLSPDDIQLNGVQFGEGITYESPLFDASGYNQVMLFLNVSGSAGDLAMDVELHAINPFLDVNPAPLFDFTFVYGGMGFSADGDYGITWGAHGFSPGPGTGTGTDWKQANMLMCAFHFSVVVSGAIVTLTGRALLCDAPEPACA